MERKLVAIVAADVVGYSRLMSQDEAGTLAALRSQQQSLIQPQVSGHGGRIVKLMGDGVLAEFASVVHAVECAVELQQAIEASNLPLAADRRMRLRIGVTFGDVMVEDGDIYGDGVNIATRLEQLAEPGGICISGDAYDQVRHKLRLSYRDIGEQRVSNVNDRSASTGSVWRRRANRAIRARIRGAGPLPGRRSPTAPASSSCPSTISAPMRSRTFSATA